MRLPSLPQRQVTASPPCQCPSRSGQVACLATQQSLAPAAPASQQSQLLQRSGNGDVNLLHQDARLCNNVVQSKLSRPTAVWVQQKHNKRMRIAVDVDEVLGRFLHSLNQYALEEYGLDYNLSDFSEYNFAKIWGCTQDESNAIVHKFFQSRHFAFGILPIPGALASLQRLRSVCELVVVTSRQHIIRQPTLEWIHLHFPHIFAEVHFGNHWALHGTSRKKSEICREIGATMLIDDNPVYAAECAEAGLQVLLYDWQTGYPWSKTADGGPRHPRIVRVSDWEAVEVAVAAALAAQQSKQH